MKPLVAQSKKKKKKIKLRINGAQSCRASSGVPVFFMAEVSELRMELILPRSTFSRPTPRGTAGVLWVEVEVEGAEMPAAEEVTLEALVGVVGVFGAASAFVALATVAAALLSFFLSAMQKQSNKQLLFLHMSADQYGCV